MKKTIITVNFILVVFSALAVSLALFYASSTTEVAHSIDQATTTMKSHSLTCTVDECRSFIKEEIKFIGFYLITLERAVLVLKVVALVAATGFVLNLLLAFTIKRKSM